MKDLLDYAEKLDSRPDAGTKAIHDQNDMTHPSFNNHFRNNTSGKEGQGSNNNTHLDFGGKDIYQTAGDDKPAKSTRINLDQLDQSRHQDTIDAQKTKPTVTGDAKPATGDAKPATGDAKPATGDAKPVTTTDAGIHAAAPAEGSIKTPEGTTAWDKKGGGSFVSADGKTQFNYQPGGDGSYHDTTGDVNWNGAKNVTYSGKTENGAYSLTTDSQGHPIDDKVWDKVGNLSESSGSRAPGGAHRMFTDYAGYPRTYTGGGETKTFSYYDTAKSNEPLNTKEFSQVAKEVMAKADVNHTGAVTKNDLAKAIEDPSYKGPEAQALAGLYTHYDELQKLSDGAGQKGSKSLAPSALDKFAVVEDTERKRSQQAQSGNTNKGAAETEGTKLVNGVWGANWMVNQEQHSGSNHDLVADKTNPLKSINPDGVHQGLSGDCYFLAPLASVANAHPETIKNAIKDNGNGSYTVTFPGAKNEPVTVKAPTTTELGLYNHGGQQGVWGSVMEKAYGEYRQNHDRNSGPLSKEAGKVAQEGAGGGGDPASAMAFLTGHSVHTDTELKSMSQGEMASKLEQAVSGHKAITAGINQSSLTPGRFFKEHAYSITDFDRNGKDGGTVTVRNPWGQQDNTTGGKIKISLNNFMKEFDDLEYEK